MRKLFLKMLTGARIELVVRGFIPKPSNVAFCELSTTQYKSSLAAFEPDYEMSR